MDLFSLILCIFDGTIANVNLTQIVVIAMGAAFALSVVCALLTNNIKNIQDLT